MPPFSLATWNVNSIKVRAPQVLDWLRERQPDVLGLQELKQTSEDFPAAEFTATGYSVAAHGQRTYNGVALVSRRPLRQIRRGIPELSEDPQARIVAARLEDVELINVYVPNGESVGSEKFAYKMEWLDGLLLHLDRNHRPDQPLAVFGDFNVALEDRDVHDPAAFQGQILFSEPEHAALRRFLDWGLIDLFRRFHEDGKLYSWWDYRMNAFRRNLGARIDLILVTRPLAEQAISCEIDVGPRRLERPSDHAPVLAVFQ